MTPQRDPDSYDVVVKAKPKYFSSNFGMLEIDMTYKIKYYELEFPLLPDSFPYE